MSNLNFARFLKTILDVIFVTLITACVVAIVWILISPMVIDRIGFLGTASVPVRLGTKEESQIDVTAFNTDAIEVTTTYIDDSEGTLIVETNNVLLVLVANTAKLLVGIGLTYVFKLLRDILKNVIEQTPFVLENTRFLQQLGRTMLAIAVFRPVVEYLAAAEILQNVQTTMPFQPYFRFDLEGLLVSLLIFLLAFIWSYGLELEQDQALTV